MPKEFSVDLRWRVVYLYYDDLSTVDIANTLHMSKSIVNKIIKRYNRWACVENPFKDELVYEMECITGKRVSVAALWRSLQYLGITRKKLHKAALERNEIIRAHYLATIGEHYTRNQLIFLDESAKDERSLTRLYGYSPRNIRAQKK
ncbi:homeodomain-like protein [Rhizophagus clarus]|uniref:Homeodomain-like protein n=1 Tax=Rhizophagus clarus TaxID=94130 RepID=A0A8H3L0K5_9GLOM|nr:homeodomain-like protein [Rhizophagus clarus]